MKNKNFKDRKAIEEFLDEVNAQCWRYGYKSQAALGAELGVSQVTVKGDLMNDIQIFNNPQFGEIRTTTISNEPWFVGKDVAQVLGYKDTSDAMKKHIDCEDKLTRRFADSGQNREMYLINESGLYSLILSSKLPGAKQFKRWVTSEVLPSPLHKILNRRIEMQ